MSTTTTSFETIPLNSSSLHYLHPTPHPSPTTSPDGRTAVIKTAKGSDWWHTPERDSQDGLAWGRWVDLSDEGFEVQVKASIKQQNRYDQACAFIYLSQHCWVKAGVEYDMGKLWDGAVVCNPFSDWAITPSTPSSTFTISYHPVKSHLRIFLNDTMIREVNSFAHIPGFTPSKQEDFSGFDKEMNGGGAKVFVGVMGCSPLGEGSEAVFESLEYRKGVRD